MAITIILYLFVLIFSFCLVLFAMYMLIQNLFNVPPYLPSFNRQIKAELAKFMDEFNEKKDFKAGDRPKLIDLGSGDGKIVFQAAKLGYDAYGIEINPFLIIVTRLRALFWPKSQRPHFISGSYFNHDLSASGGNYDVIFTYLFPGTMHELEEKIFSEAKTGTIIISNTFKFKDHEPNTSRNKVLVYRVQ